MPRGIPNKRNVQTSGPAPKQVRALPVVNKAVLLERFKGYPAIDVLERRMLDPNDPGSLPILLSDESPDACVNSDHQFRMKEAATTCHLCKKPTRKWMVRWVNTGIEGRWGQIKSKGYIRVEVDELKDSNDVSDLVRQKEDGGAMSGKVFVRRGDRGGEILCKMPLEVYNYLKRAQRESLKTRSNSKKALREDLAESAGAALGDEAGQTIHDGGISIESMTRTRRPLDEELADDLIEA